jgi:hypothetical protein
MFLLAASLTAGAEPWFIQTVLLMLAVFMALYGVAYVFFALTDSDALRSEKYKLQKIAIEHGLLGDSVTGLFDPAEETAGGNQKNVQIERKP